MGAEICLSLLIDWPMNMDSREIKVLYIYIYSFIIVCSGTVYVRKETKELLWNKNIVPEVRPDRPYVLCTR